MYYLTIYSYVCVNIIDSNALIYNTLDGSYFVLNLNKEINDILIIITNENACMEIKDNLYKTKEFKSFLSKIENKNMGFIEHVSFFKEKPFSPPLYDLSNDKVDITPFNRPKHLLDNLREVTIYLNDYSDTKYSNSKTVREAFKQLDYTKINNNFEELDAKKLLQFIAVLPELIIINILGGNFFQYQQLDYLLNNLLKYKQRIFFHIHYQDLSSFNNKNIIRLISNFNLNILVDFPVNLNELTQSLSKLENKNYRSVFIIENDYDFGESEEIIKNINLSSFIQVPFFNGRNLTFFKRNVFINKSDIFEGNQSIIELLIKKNSNPSYFGKLILNCDKKLYSSFFMESLDSLDSFFDSKEIIINRLIDDKKSNWNYNKFQAEPCNKCIYNFLCTPLSNYEKVSGKNNLCSIFH